ncbi:metallophosphoesterase family protein [Maribellus sp. YY47]|uniref:purple acid phosphatase family protein n=1 Tax=Maribellus sp. YY47 TaxID=2929486 RepID=UPI002000C201|nr:metallophosphoesterase family protein [Maribellus sp. YY47]MCK3682825.1 metallophosphoesterase family protein [Maribellus sp. YY47]
MKTFFSIINCLFFIGICGTGFSQTVGNGNVPEHIILNLTENPSESVAVTWRTKDAVAQKLQWAEVTDSPVLANDRQVIAANSSTITYIDGDVPPLMLTNHSAVIRDLEPGSRYLYRVGAETTWSEWIEFETAGLASDPITFIYFGDVQANIKSQWSRVIRKAFSTAPDVDFLYYAGDLINHTHSEEEWKQWFEAGSFIHASIPSMMTPGNHEYDSTALDNHWRAQFTLPENGPDMDLLSETVYYVDYQDLRMISIDADMMDESPEAAVETRNWLAKVLEETNKTWTILTLHYPFYSTKANRDNVELRENIQPLIEKYGVDMVLTGHDHAYGRGREKVESMTRPGEISGPVYVVSVSGPKLYGVSDQSWMSRKGGNTQFFQLISINQNKLNYKAYTASGEIYDEFDLVKRKGRTNKLIEKIPDTPERLYTR